MGKRRFRYEQAAGRSCGASLAIRLESRRLTFRHEPPGWPPATRPVELLPCLRGIDPGGADFVRVDVAAAPLAVQPRPVHDTNWRLAAGKEDGRSERRPPPRLENSDVVCAQQTHELNPKQWDSFGP